MSNLKENNNHLTLLHLSVLLGCVFPGGNIIGPLLVGSMTDKSYLIKRQIANIVNFQILWFILLFGILIIFWYHQFERFSYGLGINSYPLKWIVGFAIVIVLIYPILVSLIIRFTKSRNLFYPNLIRFMKVEKSADEKIV